MLSHICLVQALMEKNAIKLLILNLNLKNIESLMIYINAYKFIRVLIVSVIPVHVLQYLECREDELNELHHLLDTNHRAVTKWKTNVVETAKVHFTVCRKQNINYSSVIFLKSRQCTCLLIHFLFVSVSSGTDTCVVTGPQTRRCIRISTRT